MPAQSDSRRIDVPFLPALAVLLAILAVVSIAFMPRSHWEYDEFLFRAGVESFDPLRHHPHPPGYPLLIALGKVFTLAAGDPFTGLRALAIASTLVGFAALAAAVRNLTRSATIGLASASLFYGSCAQLVHSTMPMSDPPALMFLFVGFWGLGRGSLQPGAIRPAALLGAAFAASIGCRPQYAVAILPALLVALAMRRSTRFAVVCLGCFAVVCLTWLVPLVAATGGVAGFLDYELGQAAYVAAHDAELSRGWMTGRQVWLRMVAHPWGEKTTSAPVLAIALAGAVLAVRRRLTGLLPVAVVSVAHLLFTVSTSDPADGVRYALAFQPMVAILAAVALEHASVLGNRRALAFAGVALLVVASVWYAWPVLSSRARGGSPPVRAARWIAENVPRDAAILVDSSLRPHAAALLAGRETWPIEDGFRELWDRPDKEVWVFADGWTAEPAARVFAWAGAEHPAEEPAWISGRDDAWLDVYGKLTRNHYLVVSVIPVPPGHRYRPGAGVHPYERSARRPEWRWISPEATVEIPPGEGDLLVVFHLPAESPRAATTVLLFGGDERLAEVRVERSGLASARFPFPREGGRLTLRADGSYVPRAIGGRDRRELSVELRELRRERADDFNPSGL